MSRPTTYQYTTLPSSSSIRLIHLFAGEFKSQLRCEIVETALETKPVYEALSYVWGSAECPQSIFVQGDGSDMELNITANLASALQRFRTTSSVRSMWVDSICINQCNKEEKSQQVPLMGDIYRQASGVLIWLGEDTEPERPGMAFDCLNLVLKTASKISNLDNADEYRELLPYKPEFEGWLGITRPSAGYIHSSLGLPPPDSPDFQALLELFDNPWFTRAWTWQESFVAQNKIFYRSGWKVDDIALRQVVLALYSLDKLSSEKIYNSVSLYRALPMIGGASLWTKRSQSTKEYLKLSVLLGQRRGAGCTYPSDLVYSLLGAAWNVPEIKVDYDWPFEAVFAQTLWHFIQQQGNLNMLSEIAPDQSVPSLPTWAPDWRQYLTNFGIARSTTGFAASGSSRAAARLSEDFRTLSLRGIEVDRVLELKSAKPSDLEKWVGSMFGTTEKLETLYPPTREPLEKALRRVVFLDQTNFMVNQSVARWQTGSHEKYEKIVADALSGQEGRVNYGRLLLRLIKNRQCRQVFVTKKGRLGITSESVRPDDVIVILLGGQVPYILRPASEAGHYTYVADCYLHGFMDGECLVDARASASSSQDALDTTWLQNLHEGELPFETQEFHLR